MEGEREKKCIYRERKNERYICIERKIYLKREKDKEREREL